MSYKVKALVPARPTKPPLYVRDLEHGELAVITEAGDDFGKCILVVKENNGRATWLVCLDDAIVSSHKWSQRICRLVKPPEKVTLVSGPEAEGVAQ